MIPRIRTLCNKITLLQRGNNSTRNTTHHHVINNTDQGCCNGKGCVIGCILFCYAARISLQNKNNSSSSRKLTLFDRSEGISAKIASYLSWNTYVKVFIYVDINENIFNGWFSFENVCRYAYMLYSIIRMDGIVNRPRKKIPAIDH